MRAALAVSKEMILLYWRIGREILDRQTRYSWGTSIVQRLAEHLKLSFPGIDGFSIRNLRYMRAFAGAYPDEQIVQQVVALLPWGHHVCLLDKVKDPDQRLWYTRAAHECGWSRAILEIQIETNLYGRQGKATTNFANMLPPPQSDLAQQILKDPYNFDFLTLASDAHERHLERGLLEHVQRFLLELGAGFLFVGSQYHLDIGNTDFYIDLLFYHLKLRCFVVVDLKMTKFIPEYAGKMNFYLSAVDDLLRHPGDAPSIGLILCKRRERVMVEYALRNTATPIGVAEFSVTDALPSELAGSLPTVSQIEAELSNGRFDEEDDQERDDAKK